MRVERALVQERAAEGDGALEGKRVPYAESLTRFERALDEERVNGLERVKPYESGLKGGERTQVRASTPNPE
jgi:hypothetical protein